MCSLASFDSSSKLKDFLPRVFAARDRNFFVPGFRTFFGRAILLFAPAYCAAASIVKNAQPEFSNLLQLSPARCDARRLVNIRSGPTHRTSPIFFTRRRNLRSDRKRSIRGSTFRYASQFEPSRNARASHRNASSFSPSPA